MNIVKLILDAKNPNLPTIYPALYFGSPDGKVYAIYQRHYVAPLGISEIEFVIDISEEFSYDYEKEKLIDPTLQNDRTPFIDNTAVDKPNHKLKPFKSSRSTKTFRGAVGLLNYFILVDILKNKKYI